MMAYGIAAAVARLTGLIKGGGWRRKGLRLALVLRVENAPELRAGLGPALFEQMRDRLLLRLISELRLLPQPRAPGLAELCGMLAAPQPQMAAGVLARLRAICDAGIDLPELRVFPMLNAVLVADDDGDRPPATLYAFGRAMLDGGKHESDVVHIGHAMWPAQDLPLDSSPALPEARVRLRFQPQVCCDTGKVLALRVLPYPCRQGSPDRPLAEELHDAALDHDTECTLRQALVCLQGWDRLGLNVPLLSLALSGRELAGPDIADTILWELDRLDLSPRRLEIEIAEQLTPGVEPGYVATSLQRLAQAGCRIGLGGFGSGSVGLADLRRLCVGRVRIGRDFVEGCDRGADQQRMILAVLALAEHLGLATLADDVSSPEENAFLAQIGFDAVQGAVVAPPLDASEVADFLLAHARALPLPFEIRRRA